MASVCIIYAGRYTYIDTKSKMYCKDYKIIIINVYESQVIYKINEYKVYHIITIV